MSDEKIGDISAEDLRELLTPPEESRLRVKIEKLEAERDELRAAVVEWRDALDNRLSIHFRKVACSKAHLIVDAHDRLTAAELRLRELMEDGAMSDRVYNAAQVVKQLTGPVTAVGESHTDANRLDNLYELGAVITELLADVLDAAEDADRHEASMQRIGRQAKSILRDVRKLVEDE